MSGFVLQRARLLKTACLDGETKTPYAKRQHFVLQRFQIVPHVCQARFKFDTYIANRFIFILKSS
jgi:hypothetical protein